MLKKLSLGVYALLILCGLAACVDKPSTLPTYEAQSFQSQIASGQTVVLHIYSTYCSPCHAQNDVLDILRQDPDFQGVTFLHLDFDAQKDALKAFKVEEQSVILLFKEGKEAARIDQITDVEKIRATLKAAL